MQAATLKIDDVIIPDGRKLRGQVHALADSIREVGLINPILVTKNNHLIAGLHRFRACQSIGMKEIPVRVCDLDEVRAQLAHIDENLLQPERTPLERSELLAERRKLYLALHPETAPGVAGAMAKHGLQTRNSAFAEETAKKTGESVRRVQEVTRTGERLDPEAKEDLRDTAAAKSQRQLEEVAKEPPERQRKIAKALKTGKAKTVKEAKDKTKSRKERKAETEKARSSETPAGMLQRQIKGIAKHVKVLAGALAKAGLRDHTGVHANMIEAMVRAGKPAVPDRMWPTMLAGVAEVLTAMSATWKKVHGK